jgi:mannose-1-phosphate guanylyltransferase
VIAVLLVGGEGTRLRPLTYTIPKQMLPVVGRPLLERVVTSLVRHGVTSVVLSLGYLPDRFISAYPDFRVAGVPVSYAVEPEPLDTAGGLAYAARHADVDETFLVVNGDNMTDFDVTALLAHHRALGARATIALHPVEDPSRFGVVTTDAAGWVTAFVEKPPLGEAPSNEINAGMYVLEPSVLDLIPIGARVSIERETFPALVASRALAARPDHAYWIDTGTPDAYLRAHRDVLTGARRVEITGEVVDGSWIDAAADVDSTATVRTSAVGPRCRVGAGSVVAGSVLLAGAVVDAHAVVEDSVIGPDARVGTSAVLRNLSVVGAGETVPENATLDGARVGGPR